MAPLYRDDISSEASDDDFEHVKQTTLDDITLSTPTPGSPTSEQASPQPFPECPDELTPTPGQDPVFQLVEFDDDGADPSLLGFLGELSETALQIATSTRNSVRCSARKYLSALKGRCSDACDANSSSQRRCRSLILTHLLHGYVAFVLVACVAMLYMHIGQALERRACRASDTVRCVQENVEQAAHNGSIIKEALGFPPPASPVSPESPCLVSWKPLDGKSHSQKFMCGGVKYYMTLNANVKEEGKMPRLAAFLSTAADSAPSDVAFTLSFIGRKGSDAECATRKCRKDGLLLWQTRFTSRLKPTGGVGTMPVSRADALRDMLAGGSFYLEVSIDKVQLL